jgi:hypothetical protein
MKGNKRQSSDRRRLVELLLNRTGIELEPAEDTRPSHVPGQNRLSVAQEQLWSRPGSGNEVSRNIISAFTKLTGALNVYSLTQAVNEIARRHEVLRTRFSIRFGELVPEVRERLEIELDLVDVSKLGETEEAIERPAKEAGERGLKVEEFPLITAKLLLTGEEEKILILTTHQLISDGWSMGVMFDEKCGIYSAFSHGDPSSLAEVEVQYGDYAVWEREQAKAKESDKERRYSRELPSMTLSSFNLGTRDGALGVLEHERGAETTVLTRELSDKLKKLSWREGATMYMTLLAAFIALVNKHSGREDVVVGMPIVRREWVGSDRLVGPYVNISVMCVELRGNPTFREVLRRVKEVALQAHERREAPFEKLFAKLRSEKNLNQAPLIDVTVMLEQPLPAPIKLAGLELKLVDVRGVASEPGLTLVLRETDKGFKHELVCKGYSMDAGMMKAILRRYKTILGIITASPERRLSDLEFSSLAVDD